MSRLIVTKLNGVRRKHAAVAAGRAVAAAAGLVACCLAAGMSLDRWMDLSAGWRATLLATDAAAAAAALFLYGVRPVARGPTVEQAALWVERFEPTFRSRLISAVQFRRGGDGLNGGSPALVAAMVDEAERAARNVDFNRVVSTRTLRRTLAVTLAVLVAFAGATAYARAVAVPLLERALLVPGVEVPRRTRITADSGDRAVARGDAVTLTARAAGDLPPAGHVRLKYAGGGGADVPLSPDPATPGGYAVTVANVQDPFTYAVLLGDDATPPRHVRVSVRPAVVSVACAAVYPAYAKLPPADRSPDDLHVPAGGRLSLRVKANKPLRASPDVAGNHVHLVGPDLDFPLPGDVGDPSDLHATDGRANDLPVPAGTAGFRIELVDADGLRSVDPVVYRVTIDPDQPPMVRMTAPAADAATITPMAKPAVTVEAEDDFGVARLTLRYRLTHAGQEGAVQDDPHGLSATYFAAPDLSGTGVARPEPALNREWAVDRPPAGVSGTFGVRWVGTVTAQASGDYVFRGEFTGGVRLWVDGQPLIDRWSSVNNVVESRPVHLTAGRPVPLRVDAQGSTLSATGTARLLWRANGVGWTAVPHEAFLRPAAATTGPTADAVPLDPAGLPARSVRRQLAWDLSRLPTPPVPGDTVEVWAEATDNNDVTGPGVAASEHRTFRVVTAEQKRKELLDHLGDYMGRVHGVSDDERTLNEKVGKLVPNR